METESRPSDSLRNRVARYTIQGLVGLNMVGMTMIGLEESVHSVVDNLPALIEYGGENLGRVILLGKPLLDGMVSAALTYISVSGTGKYLRDYQEKP